MNTTPRLESGSSRGRMAGGRRRPAGFTMVEVAIALAVVAFALVAIVGVLPTGLSVQRQNREETIINQEGALWLSAISSGSIGLNYLTNYVDQIEQINTDIRSFAQQTNWFAGLLGVVPGVPSAGVQRYLNGRDIVGLLSYPKYIPVGTRVYDRNTRAFVRALTGTAAEKGARNEYEKEMAFRYRMSVEVLPYGYTNFITNMPAPSTVEQRAALANLMRFSNNLQENLWDVRVTLDWPIYMVRDEQRVGANRKQFRTFVSGIMTYTNAPFVTGTQVKQVPLPLLQPAEFQLQSPPP